MLTFVQMQAMNLKELLSEIQKAESELLEVKMGIHLNQEKNTAKKTHLRKHIARLKTVYTWKNKDEQTDLPEKTSMPSSLAHKSS